MNTAETASIAGEAATDRRTNAIGYEVESSGPAPNFFAPYALTTWGGMLTWVIDGRVLSLGPLVAGLVQLAVVLAFAVFVYRRYRR
jgi:hypothetical protein